MLPGRPGQRKSWAGDDPGEQIVSVPSAASLRAILTPAVLLRIGVGWVAFIALLIAQPLQVGQMPSPVLFLVLAAIVAVIVVSSSGVVAQAERLADRLGDPYGTLVLTLSIVLIEVILISAVMLGPGEHTTIARDSVMASTMIILTLVIGAALLVGGLRHRDLRVNRTGVSSYLSLLVVLLATAFALPAVMGTGGAYPAGLAIPVLTLTILLYAFFLYRQTGAQSSDFKEVGATTSVSKGSASKGAVSGGVASSPAVAEPVTSAIPAQPRRTAGFSLHEHGTEVIVRSLVLLITAIPIVLLSHHMAVLLEDGLGRLGAPVVLSGVLIAVIVLLPETITTIRAAWMGEGQRVTNLAHGALVSCVGLTLPVVLAIGLLTGQTVVLAERPVNLLLLAVSLLLSLTTFSAQRVTALHGAAHLFVFVLYAISLFS